SLAIGKEGLNARLAARLTGWKVDIQSESEFARVEAEAAFEGDEEEFSGRCAAILSNGKRCPNTAVPGSRYCGIPAHRELAAKEAAGDPVDDGASGQGAAREPEEPVAEAIDEGDEVDPDAAGPDAASAPSERRLAEGEAVDEDAEPKIAGETGSTAA
ncbi:MAG: transcription termination/antitermination protein NusA, partial [Actinobacteria bacterium]|nr:transcription termination/antitermination protein NusA [Actinomycetota bacterium]